MRNGRVLRSMLVAGLAAAAPEALGAVDEADLQRTFETRPGVTAHSSARARDEVIDHRAVALIEAFNSPSIDALLAFELHHRSPEVGAIRWLDMRLAEFTRFRDRWGKIDVHAFHPIGESLLAVTARSERTGEWISIVLTFERHAPYLLRTVRMDDMVVPV